MNPVPLIVCQGDFERLNTLIRMFSSHPGCDQRTLELLGRELERARIVPDEELPPDVVRMNSRVGLRDLELDESDIYELVYPRDADLALRRISILAPVGSAILGYRVGDVVEWPVPAGVSRLLVDGVFAPTNSEFSDSSHGVGSELTALIHQ